MLERSENPDPGRASGNKPSSFSCRSLDELVHDLLDHYRSIQSSPHTLQRLRNCLRRFLTFLADHYDLHTADRLHVQHIDAYQQALADQRTAKGLPLKPITINTAIKSVRVFLDYLHERGYLLKPLARHLVYVKEPKLLPTSVLTHAQVRKLMRKIDTTTALGIRDRAALELLYSSGIRVGEMEKLRVADVDLERCIARISGKGRKERFVPIGKTALRWMLTYVRGVRPFLLQGGKTPVLFVTTTGRPFTAHDLRLRIHDYARRAKLDVTVTPHTFRRTCTTEMIKSNANLYHVKELLGHEKLDTLHHYTRLDITDLQKTHAKCHPREKDR